MTAHSSILCPHSFIVKQKDFLYKSIQYHTSNPQGSSKNGNKNNAVATPEPISETFFRAPRLRTSSPSSEPAQIFASFGNSMNVLGERSIPCKLPWRAIHERQPKCRLFYRRLFMCRDSRAGAALWIDTRAMRPALPSHKERQSHYCSGGLRSTAEILKRIPEYNG